MVYEVLPNVSLLKAIVYTSPLVLGVLGAGYYLLIKNPRDLRNANAEELRDEQPTTEKNIQV